MMGLIGQGCEHGDVLEVTGTNTPTQKTHPVCVGNKKMIVLGASVCRKRRIVSCLCLLYSV